jgi:hypothetical protein
MFYVDHYKRKDFESGKPVGELKERQSEKSVDEKVILHIRSSKYYFVIKIIYFYLIIGS